MRQSAGGNGRHERRSTTPGEPLLPESDSSFDRMATMKVKARTNTLPRLLSAAMLSMSMAACAGTSAQVHELQFERYQLDNGLTVILHQDRRLPTVSINLWYWVGSKDEPERRSGFAHLFEHLMFRGTAAVPHPQFDIAMERFGGSNNASTSTDRTNYFESGPSELLETFLFLEADRMENLAAAMNQEKLDDERRVVRNERRERIENRPYGIVGVRLSELLYPADHPYHRSVIGSHADLEAATVDDVKEFFHRFYFAANASLVVAGDFDLNTARKLVEKYFSDLERRPVLPRETPPVPTLSAVVRETVTDKVQLPLVMMAWHSPPLYAPGDAAMDVLADALGGGKSSRLYRRLVYEKQLAQGVSAGQRSSLLGSQFTVSVLARPGVELDAIEAEVDAVLTELRDEGLEPAELDRARNSIETSFWRGLESLGTRAELMNTYEFYFGDPGAIGRDLQRYRALTVAKADTWARKVLSLDGRVVLRVVPAPPLDPSAEAPTSQGN